MSQARPRLSCGPAWEITWARRGTLTALRVSNSGSPGPTPTAQNWPALTTAPPHVGVFVSVLHAPAPRHPTAGRDGDNGRFGLVVFPSLASPPNPAKIRPRIRQPAPSS